MYTEAAAQLVLCRKLEAFLHSTARCTAPVHHLLCVCVRQQHASKVCMQSFPGKTPQESAAQHKWEEHFSEQQKEQARQPDKGVEAAYAPPPNPPPAP